MVVKCCSLFTASDEIPNRICTYAITVAYVCAYTIAQIRIVMILVWRIIFIIYLQNEASIITQKFWLKTDFHHSNYCILHGYVKTKTKLFNNCVLQFVAACSDNIIYATEIELYRLCRCLRCFAMLFKYIFANITQLWR